MRRWPLLAALAVALPALAHDWEKPKDGVLTEKQVDAYLDACKKEIKAGHDQLVWLEKHKDNSAELLAGTRDYDERVKKIHADSGLAEREYEWVGKEVNDIHAIWWVWSVHMKPDLESKLKEANENVAAAQKAKDEVARCKKTGRKPMTDDERKDAQKADLEKDLADREQRANEDLAAATKTRDVIVDMFTKYEKDNVDRELAKHPAKNVAIVKARRERIAHLMDCSVVLADPDEPPKK